MYLANNAALGIMIPVWTKAACGQKPRRMGNVVRRRMEGRRCLDQTHVLPPVVIMGISSGKKIKGSCQ